MRLLPLIALLATAPFINAATIAFDVTNLSSDVPGLALVTDPDMVNPWGISASPTSPLWIAANGTGTSLIYNGAGVKQGLIVTIPGDGSVTGTAFNSDSSSFNGDRFLFVSQDGTVSGWRPALGTAAEILTPADAEDIYTGMATGLVGGSGYAYLANFHSGTIEVMKGTAAAPDLTGSFTDPTLPSGYAPFNVMNLGGTLYVAYALQDADAEDEVAGPGNGYVSAFDLSGNFLRRVTSNGALDAPWGLALAPSNYGEFSGALLVGNFGDGRLHAYNASTGAFLGTFLNSSSVPIEIEGLWGIYFGNGGNGGNRRTLYFAAGIEDETHGLFGDLAIVPEPASLFYAALGLAGMLAFRRTRR